jgi:diaminopimelate epimerase
MIELVVSQGRVADRAPGMIEGAARTARALEHRYGVKGRFVGTPAAPADDDWTVSLGQARETLVELGQTVAAGIAAGNLIAMTANTCAASLATLPVVAREYPDAVVLWIDAHGDFNTPDTTQSGYLGGMALAGVCGLWDSGHGGGIRPEQVILVGARDIDPLERELLRTAGVRIIPPAEATADRVTQAVDGARVWIHIDWDVLEPGFVPADYHVPDGMLPAQIRSILESLPAKDVLGIELAEFKSTADESVDDKAVAVILDMVTPVFDSVMTGPARGAPMTTSNTLRFTKMHGAGNDFVVLDLRDTGPPSPELCRALADRHRGVGCDLILAVKPPRSAHAVASFEIWTADGSPSPQCGNGARCIAAWLLRAGIAQGKSFELDSPSNTHVVRVLGDNWFSIDLGVPQFAPDQVPLFGFEQQKDLYEIDLRGGSRLSFAAVSTGNPHAVIEVDDVDIAAVSQIGPAVQNAGVFLPTVNVGFTQVVSRDRIRLRVYEYGAGETLACGSGACAAAAVLMRRGRVDRNVAVALPGGELHITWPDAGERIVLAGPAEFVYEGQFTHASVQQHS